MLIGGEGSTQHGKPFEGLTRDGEVLANVAEGDSRTSPQR